MSRAPKKIAKPEQEVADHAVDASRDERPDREQRASRSPALSSRLPAFGVASTAAAPAMSTTSRIGSERAVTSSGSSSRSA